LDSLILYHLLPLQGKLEMEWGVRTTGSKNFAHWLVAPTECGVEICSPPSLTTVRWRDTSRLKSSYLPLLGIAFFLCNLVHGTKGSSTIHSSQIMHHFKSRRSRCYTRGKSGTQPTTLFLSRWRGNVRQQYHDRKVLPYFPRVQAIICMHRVDTVFVCLLSSVNVVLVVACVLIQVHYFYFLVI
jgi:hypothetical protein